MNQEFKSTACPEFEPLLEDHLTGDLGGPDAARLSEHVKSCAGCRSALDLASLSRRLLSVAEPMSDPGPGPGFSHLVMARIRAAQERAVAQKSIWLPFVSLAWRFALTASFAAIALLAYDNSSRGRMQQEMAVLRADQPRDLVYDSSTPPQNRDEILMMMAETNHGK